MTAIVTAPLVITKKPDGSDLYLYQDATVPDFVSKEAIDGLKAKGLVRDLTAGEAKLAALTEPISESN